MRIEKINSSQIRCVVTKQDLAERNITTSELKYGSTATKALFQEVLKQAKEKYGFNQEDLPIMIEAVPMNKEELVLIISAVEDAEELDPHFAHFDESGTEEALFPEGNAFPEPDRPTFKYAVFRFTEMDQVIRFAKRIVSFPGKSSLYRGNGAHEFLLVLERPAEMDTKDYCLFLNRVSEFGELIPESPTLAAELREHKTSVMENAHRLLALM